nr:MAG TPA: deoxyribosyltransferase [Caudoviricetes sp.]
MIIYISGTITNNPNYIKEFDAAEKKLTKEGHTVINPIKSKGFSYKEYIDMGLFDLMHCDAIYMLSNYNKKSKGATLELNYAKTVDLKIIWEKNENE